MPNEIPLLNPNAARAKTNLSSDYINRIEKERQTNVSHGLVTEPVSVSRELRNRTGLPAYTLVQMDSDEINDYLSAVQSGWAKAGNSAVLFFSELLSSAISQTGVIGGAIINAFDTGQVLSGQDNDFAEAFNNGSFGGGREDFKTNALIWAGRAMSDYFHEKFPIYTPNKVETGKFIDRIGTGSWYATNIPSLGTAIGSFVPALALDYATGKLGGKLLSMSKLPVKFATKPGLARWEAQGRKVAQYAKAVRYNPGRGAVDAAGRFLTSRAGRAVVVGAGATIADAGIEAIHTFEDMRDYALSQGMSREDALKFANDAASEHYRQGIYTNLGLNVGQWMLLGGIAKGVADKMTYNMGMALTREAGKLKIPFKNPLSGWSRAWHSKLAKGGGLFLTEAAEEGFMDVGRENAIRYAKTLHGFPTENAELGYFERLKEYMGYPRVQDSFIWGGLGGLLIGGVMNMAQSKWNKEIKNHQQKRINSVVQRLRDFRTLLKDIEVDYAMGNDMAATARIEKILTTLGHDLATDRTFSGAITMINSIIESNASTQEMENAGFSENSLKLMSSLSDHLKRMQNNYETAFKLDMGFEDPLVNYNLQLWYGQYLSRLEYYENILNSVEIARSEAIANEIERFKQMSGIETDVMAQEIMNQRAEREKNKDTKDKSTKRLEDVLNEISVNDETLMGLISSTISIETNKESTINNYLNRVQGMQEQINNYKKVIKTLDPERNSGAIASYNSEIQRLKEKIKTKNAELAAYRKDIQTVLDKYKAIHDSQSPEAQAKWDIAEREVKNNLENNQDIVDYKARQEHLYKRMSEAEDLLQLFATNTGREYLAGIVENLIEEKEENEVQDEIEKIREKNKKDIEGLPDEVTHDLSELGKRTRKEKYQDLLRNSWSLEELERVWELADGRDFDRNDLRKDYENKRSELEKKEKQKEKEKQNKEQEKQFNEDNKAKPEETEKKIEEQAEKNPDEALPYEEKKPEKKKKTLGDVIGAEPVQTVENLPKKVTNALEFSLAVAHIEAIFPSLKTVNEVKTVIEYIKNYLKQLPFTEIAAQADIATLNQLIADLNKIQAIINTVPVLPNLLNHFRKQGVKERSLTATIRKETGLTSAAQKSIGNTIASILENIEERVTYRGIWSELYNIAGNKDSWNKIRVNTNSFKKECEDMLNGMMQSLYEAMRLTYVYSNGQLVLDKYHPLSNFDKMFDEAAEQIETIIEKARNQGFDTEFLNNLYTNLEEIVTGLQTGWNKFVADTNTNIIKEEVKRLTDRANAASKYLTAENKSKFESLGAVLATLWETKANLTARKLLENKETISELWAKFEELMNDFAQQIQKFMPENTSAFRSDVTWFLTDEGLAESSKLLSPEATKLNNPQFSTEVMRAFELFRYYAAQTYAFVNGISETNTRGVENKLGTDMQTDTETNRVLPIINAQDMESFYATAINPAAIAASAAMAAVFEQQVFYGVNDVLGKYISWFSNRLDDLQKFATKRPSSTGKIELDTLMLYLVQNQGLGVTRANLHEHFVALYFAMNAINNRIENKAWLGEAMASIEASTQISETLRRTLKQKVADTYNRFEQISKVIGAMPTATNPLGITSKHFDTNGFLKNTYITDFNKRYPSIDNMPVQFRETPVSFDLITALHRTTANFDKTTNRYLSDTVEYDGETWTYADIAEALTMLENRVPLTAAEPDVETGHIPLYMDFKGRRLKVGSVRPANLTVKGVKFTTVIDNVETFRSPYASVYGQLLRTKLGDISKGAKTFVNLLYSKYHGKLYGASKVTNKDLIELIKQHTAISTEENARTDLNREIEYIVRMLMGVAFHNNSDFSDSQLDIEANMTEENVESIISALDPLFYEYLTAHDIAKSKWSESDVKEAYRSANMRWATLFLENQQLYESLSSIPNQNIRVSSLRHNSFNFNSEAMNPLRETVNNINDIDIVFLNDGVAMNLKTGERVSQFGVKHSDRNNMFVKVNNLGRISYIPLRSSVTGEMQGLPIKDGTTMPKVLTEYISDSIMDILDADINGISNAAQRVTRKHIVDDNRNNHVTSVGEILDDLGDVIIVNKGIRESIAAHPTNFYFNATKSFEMDEKELKIFNSTANGKAVRGVKHRVEFKTLTHISKSTDLHRVTLNEISRAVITFENGETKEFIRFREVGTHKRQERVETQRAKAKEIVLGYDKLGYEEINTSVQWSGNLLLGDVVGEDNPAYVEYTDFVKKDLAKKLALKSADMVRSMPVEMKEGTTSLKFKATTASMIQGSSRRQSANNYHNPAELYHNLKHRKKNETLAQAMANTRVHRSFHDYIVETEAVFVNINPVKDASGRVITLSNPESKLRAGLNVEVVPQTEVGKDGQETVDTKWFFDKDRTVTFGESIEKGFFQNVFPNLSADEITDFTESMPESWKTIEMTLPKYPFDKNTRRARYTRNAHTLEWNPESNVFNNKTITIATLFHELIHDGFSSLSPELQAKALEFAKQVKAKIKDTVDTKTLSENDTKYLSDWLDVINAVPNGLEEIFTYGLTDRIFREILNNISAEGIDTSGFIENQKGSLWERILNFVFRLLGFNTSAKGFLTERIENVFIAVMNENTKSKESRLDKDLQQRINEIEKQREFAFSQYDDYQKSEDNRKRELTKTFAEIIEFIKEDNKIKGKDYENYTSEEVDEFNNALFERFGTETAVAFMSGNRDMGIPQGFGNYLTKENFDKIMPDVEKYLLPLEDYINEKYDRLIAEAKKQYARKDTRYMTVINENQENRRKSTEVEGNRQKSTESDDSYSTDISEEGFEADRSLRQEEAKRIAANAVMPRTAKSVSEAQEMIKPLIGKLFINSKLGITGSLSGRSIRKLGTQKETERSDLQAKAVANIDILFQNAEFDITHADYKHNRNIKQIHRLGALMYDEVTEDYAPVMITVKEFNTDKDSRIYSVEAVDTEIKEKSAGLTTDAQMLEGHVPIADFVAKIEQLIEIAKSASEIVENQSSKDISYYEEVSYADTKIIKKQNPDSSSFDYGDIVSINNKQYMIADSVYKENEYFNRLLFLYDMTNAKVHIKLPLMLRKTEAIVTNLEKSADKEGNISENAIKLILYKYRKAVDYVENNKILDSSIISKPTYKINITEHKKELREVIMADLNNNIGLYLPSNPYRYVDSEHIIVEFDDRVETLYGINKKLYDIYLKEKSEISSVLETDDFIDKLDEDTNYNTDILYENNSVSEKNNTFAAEIINNNGVIDYDELERTADAIEQGIAYIDRLSLAEEQGRRQGGRRNVEASILLSTNERANSEEIRDARTGAIGERAKRQESLLKEYAQKVGIWINSEEIEKWEYKDTGMEARIYKDPDIPNRVLKVVYNYKNFSETLLEYLDNRISLHNFLFKDAETFYELVGFTETYGAVRAVKGQFFAPVLRQKYVQGNEFRANEMPLLDAEMKRRGFEKIRGVYVNRDYIIKDLNEDNVMKDKNNNIHFIDTVPSLNTPKDSFGGTRQYGSGNVIFSNTDISYGENKNNLENSEKSSIFAENLESNGNTKETGMDNRRAVGSSALRELVGEQPKRDRILEAIAAGSREGNYGTATKTRRSSWNKERFLGTLEVTALSNGTWISDIHSIAGKSIAKGQENEVYRSIDGKKVIKVNNLSPLNADYDFNTFIDRLQSHNELFTNALYKMIGFGENSFGETSVILEQPYIDNGMPATQQEIDSYLKAQGFKYTKISDGSNGWTNGIYEMWDVAPRNVLKDKNGTLYFIDTVVNHVNRSNSVESNNNSNKPKGKTLDDTGLPLC